MNDERIRCVAYTRYSSFGQNPLSIVQQKNCITKYVNDNNWVIIKWFSDEARSGMNTKRDGFNAMVQYIEKYSHKLKYVVADQIDRISRNNMDYWQFKKMLLDREMDIRSAKNEVVDSVVGHLTEGLTINTAQYFAEVTGQRSKQRLLEVSEAGNHCGGTAPLGFDIKDSKLVVNKLEAPAVKEIFKLYLEGNGYGAIATELNRKGYLTKKGVPFGKNSIREILVNEKYMGCFTYNKSSSKKKFGKNAGSRNTHKHKDESEIIRIENNHGAIVSKEIFEEVQDLMALNGNRDTAKDRSYLLRGLVCCSSCGRVMTGETYSSGNRKGVKYSYYKCPGKEVGQCSGNKINRWNLDTAVVELLMDGIFKDSESQKLAGIANYLVVNNPIQNNKLMLTKKYIADQKRKLANLTHALSSTENEFSQKRILKQMSVVEDLLKQQEEELLITNKKLSTRYSPQEVEKALKIFPEYLKSNANAMTHNLLLRYIKSIQVSETLVTIDVF